MTDHEGGYTKSNSIEDIERNDFQSKPNPYMLEHTWIKI